MLHIPLLSWFLCPFNTTRGFVRKFFEIFTPLILNPRSTCQHSILMVRSKLLDKFVATKLREWQVHGREVEVRGCEVRDKVSRSEGFRCHELRFLDGTKLKTILVRGHEVEIKSTSWVRSCLKCKFVAQKMARSCLRCKFVAWKIRMLNNRADCILTQKVKEKSL